MHGITFLADIYPDLEHWRRLFPKGSRKIDTKAALAYFIRACLAAGEYEPEGRAASRAELQVTLPGS